MKNREQKRKEVEALREAPESDRAQSLLDLRDESKPEGKFFQERFPDLKIVTPVLLLKEFGKGLHKS